MNLLILPSFLSFLSSILAGIYVFSKRDALELIVKWKAYLAFISFICLAFIVSILFSDSAVKSIFIGIGDIIISIGETGYYFNIVLLLSIILIIVNLENTFRHSKGIERWKIKYPVVGIIVGFCFF